MTDGMDGADMSDKSYWEYEDQGGMSYRFFALLEQVEAAYEHRNRSWLDRCYLERIWHDMEDEFGDRLLQILTPDGIILNRQEWMRR